MKSYLNALTRQQPVRFAAAGLINTGVDFTLFNALILLGIPLILANTVSVGVALGVAYRLHSGFVFAASARTVRNFGLFCAVTVLSSLVVQNAVVYYLIDSGHAQGFAEALGSGVMAPGLLHNVAKFSAVFLSACANFLLYRFWVFKAAD